MAKSKKSGAGTRTRAKAKAKPKAKAKAKSKSRAKVKVKRPAAPRAPRALPKDEAWRELLATAIEQPTSRRKG